MGNRRPTDRRHGEAYRDALSRSRRIIERLRERLAATTRSLTLTRASRDNWKRRAIKSGGIRL